ncbi:MAG: cellulase family glycosylhydrolase [Candidatus Microthrix parvicella]
MAASPTLQPHRRRRAGLLALVGIALLALAPVHPAGAQTTHSWDAFEQVTGANGREYIADSQGRALQLRGVNIKTGDPADGARDEVLDAIAARGFNLLRLSVFWEQVEPEQGEYDQAYLDDIDAVITSAEQRGIWVVVSFHQDTFGSAFGGHGIPPWATKDDGLPFEDTGSFLTNYLQPGVQAAWENLYEDPDIRAAQAATWTHVAAEYSDHPNVIGYDLLNEPFGKIREGEDLFTAAKRVESVQLTAMYQRLTDAIRTADEQGWMFIEAPNLASLGIATSLGRVNDERVVFFPHMYNTDIELEIYNGSGDPSGYSPAFFENWANAITTYTDSYKVPMMVGEWGVPTPYPGIDRYIAQVLETMEATTSGWAQFNGCFGEGYCTFGPDGEDRVQIDQIVQPYAQAIAGLPDNHHYDPATRTLRITYADGDATGATEIAVPATKLYPKGWRLDVDGTKVEPSTEQPAPGVDLISVEVPNNGTTHTLCLTPTEAPQSCATAPVDAGSPPPVGPSSPNDPPSSGNNASPSENNAPSSENQPTSGAIAKPLSPRFTG